MKKILSLLLAMLLCLGAFVACNDEEPSSSSRDETNEESVVVVDYDKIGGLALKSDAPNFAIYKTYDELLQILEVPLKESERSKFDDCYALLLHNIAVPFSYFSSWECTNMIFGIGCIGEDQFESKVFLHIEVTLEEEGTDDEKYLNNLIFVPKTEFGQRTDFSSYQNKLEIIWTWAE